MFLNYSQNVCEALANTVSHIQKHGVAEDSRAGRVLVLPYPQITVTESPCERVLFSALRDANPFFHMVEAIWMLAGRDDAKTLNRFVRDFGDRYAETDGSIHDAYGRRWRSAFGFDQLDEVVRRLYENPYDRQTVITMWDPAKSGCNDLLGNWRGRPCNTTAFVRSNDGLLDLTVCCRSNDMLLGGHGANAVHFSILQEYLAARADLGIGKLYQLSNNAHIYEKDMDNLYSKIDPDDTQDLSLRIEDNRYLETGMHALPLFNDPDGIDEDVRKFMRYLDTGQLEGFHNYCFTNTFLPMVRAHAAHKRKNYFDAMAHVREIRSPDWRVASQEWLKRRKHRSEEKTDAA